MTSLKVLLERNLQDAISQSEGDGVNPDEKTVEQPTDCPPEAEKKAVIQTTTANNEQQVLKKSTGKPRTRRNKKKQGTEKKEQRVSLISV